MLHDDIYENSRAWYLEGKFNATTAGMAVMLENMCEEKPIGFYFDSTVRDNFDLWSTAKEFAAAGLLRLPFKRCVFHAKDVFERPVKEKFKDGAGYEGVRANTDYTVWLAEGEDQKMVMMRCSKTPTGRNGIFPVAMGIDLKSQQFELQPLQKMPAIPAEEQKMMQAWGMVTIILLMLINHPVYEKKTVEPDAALQRARIKRGKEPFSKYIYINMKPHIKAALAAGDGSVRAPHWRRGHVRRLGDGRVVPVQACLVNWEGDPTDPAAPAKKVYVV